MTIRRSPRHSVIDMVVVVILCGVGVWGFGPLFTGSALLKAGLGALILGALIGGIAAWMRWGIGLTAAVALAAYLLFGGSLAVGSTTVGGVVPTLGTIRSLVVGLTSSWMQLLTIEVPTAGYGEILLVPFVTTFISTLIAVSLALRASRPAWALVPAAVPLVTSILFGSYRTAAPALQAALFVVGAVGWLSWRRIETRSQGIRTLEVEDSARTRRMRLRVMGAVTLLVGSTVLGVVVSGVVAPQGKREVLRDHVIPPLELHEYPSPLQSFRKYVRDYKDESLFVAQGLPEGSRIRLATLDMYDGKVYSVSGNGSPTAGSFSRIRAADGVPASGSQTVDITITGLRGVWLPDTGQVGAITFTGDRSEVLESGLYYNEKTGTAVVTMGLSEGDTYSLTTTLSPSIPLAEIGQTFASIPLPEFSNVPDVIRPIAADLLSPGDSSAMQVQQLAEFLAGGGYFSHGLEGQAPSRSGHGAERIASLVGADQMIGDDEQYAVAFALMAKEMGIPVRLVMGFYPEESGEPGEAFVATGSNVHVWAEVAFSSVGWVTVDPVPAEDRTPTDQELPPKREPQPQVLQPPPPPEEPAVLPPSIPTEDQALDKSAFDIGAFLGFLAILAVSFACLTVLVSPFLVILGWKHRRRQRRRFARNVKDRFSGGFEELADHAIDHGVAVPEAMTRAERARVIDERFCSIGAVELAMDADEGVWAPDRPSRDESRRFWQEVDRALSAVEGSQSKRQRWAARLSLRSIVRPRVSTKG